MTRIKYGFHLHLDETGLAAQVASNAPEGELALKEVGMMEAQEEADEDEAFTQEWLEFWKIEAEREKQNILTYTFDGNVIRYERNQHRMPEEFIRILPQSGVMQHFFMDGKSNEAQMSEFNLHHDPASSGWAVDYEIQAFPSETKTILGFECFKMRIVQTQTSKQEGWKRVSEYEIFVTDQINLPARLVIPLYEPVTEWCALEIKASRTDSPHSFCIQRAIEIQTHLDEGECELPAVYAGLSR